MKKIFILFFMLCVVFLGYSGIANAITLSERDELNNATPGTQKVLLGTKVRAMLADGVVILVTPDTSASAAAISVSVEPSGDTGYVRTFTGSVGGTGSTLPDGNIGQIISLALTNDGGTNWVVTPDTSSGFSAITFADAGDVATVQFKNTSIGWVVIGTADTTSGPVLSAPTNPFN